MWALASWLMFPFRFAFKLTVAENLYALNFFAYFPSCLLLTKYILFGVRYMTVALHSGMVFSSHTGYEEDGCSSCFSLGHSLLCFLGPWLVGQFHSLWPLQDLTFGNPLWRQLGLLWSLVFCGIGRWPVFGAFYEFLLGSLMLSIKQSNAALRTLGVW